MKTKTVYKMGFFNRENLTVQFGGELSMPENKFIAIAAKVPDYKYQVTERESLGGGWYGRKETYEKTETNLYVIIREGKCIGMMYPYFQETIKSALLPLNKQAIDFLTKQGIPTT